MFCFFLDCFFLDFKPMKALGLMEREREVLTDENSSSSFSSIYQQEKYLCMHEVRSFNHKQTARESH